MQGSQLKALAAAAAVALAPQSFAADRIGRAAPAKDELTPVTVQPLAPNNPIPVLGTDGKYHLEYELLLANALRAPATVVKVTVVDAADPTRVLATYRSQDLLNALRAPAAPGAPSKDAVINPAEERILFVDLAFPGDAQLPKEVAHHFDLLGASSPAATDPSPVNYTTAPLPVSTLRPIILHPPLRGGNWVVTNGCCGLGGAHRSAALPINGGMWIAQRYAIDYLRLDPKGRFFEGDEAVPSNYAGYNADVLAVADGTVVDALDGLDDQVPGKLPDPSTITVQTVDGNHVVIDIGNGYYAFFAHLKKGSVAVKDGDKVRAGEVIGRLGNTGNTSAPHLHFHIMDSKSVLGSDGLPYVVDAFALEGQIDGDRLAAAKGLEGDYGGGLSGKRTPEEDRLPLNLQVVDFGGQPAQK